MGSGYMQSKGHIMIEAFILKRIRHLLSDPARWTRGEMARSMFGAPTDPAGPNATCWCVMGAIHHETKDDPFLSGSVYQILRVQLQGRAVSEFNDDPTTTHDDLILLIDKAIESTS
jgi:hypothetical protein